MSRAHHTAERKAQGDKVYTPHWAAADMVRHFAPAGRVLEPCRGTGSIFGFLPPGSLWCEIDEGRDFFLFDQEVDWIISNPPYDQTDARWLMNMLTIWFWLTVGGFGYQALTHHDWSRAFSTSWDQGAALLAVWLIALLRSAISSHNRGTENG